MSNIVNQIENIEFKIKQLARKIELIKEENANLVKENIGLRELLVEKEQKTQAIQALTFEGANALDEEAKGKVREEIDRYIQEIDECIKLMNNL
ncbi:MAG: hypothetical protein KDC57_23275 [Saprospiraceae bacterium]|nr:hypothetical protein [Saprospiraceae bacterium]